MAGLLRLLLAFFGLIQPETPVSEEPPRPTAPDPPPPPKPAPRPLEQRTLFDRFETAETNWPSARWPNFKPSELACRHCGLYAHDPDFLDKLQELRNRWGKALHINSATRCAEHNQHVGGATRSLHVPENGNAVDISIRSMTGDEPYRLKLIAESLGFKGIGKHTGFLHLDNRKVLARWFYSKAAEDLWQGWAAKDQGGGA